MRRYSKDKLDEKWERRSVMREGKSVSKGERERKEKLLGRKMESQKEIKRKKILRERFRERDLRREGRRYKENGEKVREN